ncbi:hypothetical protein OHB26_30050 [Nocardia sp. NBC_01503]|uniref:hypothetical protein n=1 Tax=Nocardia sp. NBC_01503 TaxID=2975997 RepID=UPI002E7BDAFD|nr:hypothetical protein [Nocardia sp. NBC_01503]WTL31127.1 hypothetical protein OHB26_30050 [Nocardia sp. NBC_01503]
MSTVPPRSPVERRGRSSRPSGVKQAVFLISGMAASCLLAVAVPRIGAEPVWLLGMLPAMWIVMIGLLVVSAWRLKSVVEFDNGTSRILKSR